MQTINKCFPINKPTTHKKINKHLLKIDESYQRAPFQSRVHEISKNWNYISAGSIIVGERSDGSFYVVDGQHRLKAALAIEGIVYLDCIVFESTGAEEEAKYFVVLNLNRRPPNAIQRHKAGIVAGVDDDVMVDELIRKFNISVNSSTVNAASTKIVCRSIGTLKRIYNGFGYDVLYKTLDLLCRIHIPEIPLSQHELEGLSYVLSNYEIPDMRKFETALLKCTPQELNASARNEEIILGKRGEKVYGSGVAKAINRHIRTAKIVSKENK